MSNPAHLTLQGPGEWLQMLLGLAILLLPGLAAADRIFPGRWGRWVFAPVLSLSLLPLAGVLLDYGMGVPVTKATTITYALALALWLGWARVRQFLRWLGSPRLPAWRRPRLWPPKAVWALPAIIGFVMLVHAIPHLPGDNADSVPATYVELADRGLGGLQGEGYPYPIHVDEHIHMAFVSTVMRTESADIPNPYTHEHGSGNLFTVQGFRSERGFDVALAQVVLVTDIPLAALFRFLPSLWAGYTALTLWYATKEAPGALAGAAFVAMLPTNVRFLGPGFLIPVTFGLPWLAAVLTVTLRGRGPSQFIGLMAIVTAAFFHHLTIGVLSLAAGLAATLIRPDTQWQDRISLAVATLLPLLWILPSTWQDVVTNIARETGLPFEQQVFTTPGLLLLALAVVGVVVAITTTRDARLAPHRVFALLAAIIAATMAWSLSADNSSDATYGRLLYPFFLSLAALAGLGIGWAGEAVRKALRRWGPTRAQAAAWLRLPRAHLVPRAGLAATTAMILLGATALASPLQTHFSTPYYRIHDADTWDNAELVGAGAMGPEDLFLGHPWQAPVHSAVSGARPYTVLYPGTPPERLEEYVHYLQSGGADAAWLDARGITVIISPQAPNAPHDHVGQDFYRIR